MTPESENEINIYDDEHDWCYKAANRWCAEKLDIAETLRQLSPALEPKEFKAIVEAMQGQYSKLFEAFVHGAVFGRRWQKLRGKNKYLEDIPR